MSLQNTVPLISSPFSNTFDPKTFDETKPVRKYAAVVVDTAAVADDDDDDGRDKMNKQRHS